MWRNLAARIGCDAGGLLCVTLGRSQVVNITLIALESLTPRLQAVFQGGGVQISELCCGKCKIRAKLQHSPQLHRNSSGFAGKGGDHDRLLPRT